MTYDGAYGVFNGRFDCPMLRKFQVGWSTRLSSKAAGSARLRRTRRYVAVRRATENDAWEKHTLVRWRRAGKIVVFFTIPLIWHLVIVKPEMVPDFMHDGIAHFLHDFFPGATESEDRPAIDGDFGR